MQTREPEARTPYRRAERRCWNCSTDLVLLGKSLVPHPLAPAPAPLRGGNSVRPLTSARVIANLIAPASTGSRHLVAQRRKQRRCLSGDALHHCFAAQIPAPPSPSPAPTDYSKLLRESRRRRPNSSPPQRREVVLVPWQQWLAHQRHQGEPTTVPFLPGRPRGHRSF